MMDLGRRLFEYFILEIILFTEFLYHIQVFRICQFSFIDIDSFNIFLKFYRAMDLNLFIGSDHVRFYLIGFASFKSCSQLSIRQFIKKMVAELESGDCC